MADYIVHVKRDDETGLVIVEHTTVPGLALYAEDYVQLLDKIKRTVGYLIKVNVRPPPQDFTVELVNDDTHTSEIIDLTTDDIAS